MDNEITDKKFENKEITEEELLKEINTNKIDFNLPFFSINGNIDEFIPKIINRNYDLCILPNIHEIPLTLYARKTKNGFYKVAFTNNETNKENNFTKIDAYPKIYAILNYENDKSFINNMLNLTNKNILLISNDKKYFGIYKNNTEIIKFNNTITKKFLEENINKYLFDNTNYQFQDVWLPNGPGSIKIAFRQQGSIW
ncbi:MAG: hypothetical protein ACOX3T_06640 [Bdellovibrionota bacterium]